MAGARGSRTCQCCTRPRHATASLKHLRVREFSCQPMRLLLLSLCCLAALARASELSCEERGFSALTLCSDCALLDSTVNDKSAQRVASGRVAELCSAQPSRPSAESAVLRTAAMSRRRMTAPPSRSTHGWASSARGLPRAASPRKSTPFLTTLQRLSRDPAVYDEARQRTQCEAKDEVRRSRLAHAGPSLRRRRTARRAAGYRRLEDGGARRFPDKEAASRS